MRKLLLNLIIAITLFNISKAQTYVLIPDAMFASKLQTIVPSAMTGNSLNITHTLVTLGTTYINVSMSSISNLTGIQYFASLTGLTCSGNSLTSLPALPNTLLSLSCGNNKLTTLPTLPGTLNFLSCNSNSLTALPALPNTLNYLMCAFNSLTTLPTLPNSLTQLYCYGNNIICFPVFPNSLSTADLSQNPYNCLPNYVLPAMNAYTITPLCQAGNSNGCAFVGVEELNPNNEFISVHPNPATTILNLKLTEGKSIDSFLIMDVLGRKILEQKESTTQINIEGLPKGIYQLVITSEGKSYTSKFIKE